MYLAYLDPGSGNMLVAAVVAGFAGVMVVAKMWWRRLVNKLRRRQVPQLETPVRAEQDH